MNTGAEMIQRKIWPDLSPNAGQNNLTAVQAAGNPGGGAPEGAPSAPVRCE